MSILSRLVPKRLGLPVRHFYPSLRLSTATATPPPVQPPTPPPPNKSSNGSIYALLGLAGVGGAAYYLYSSEDTVSAAPKALDYQAVYNSIASILDNVNHDDGSLGPILLRLSWHAAGTYDLKSRTGGSNGATMRFVPESAHGANAGLSLAREALEGIKKKYPSLSYADLWSLSGVVAVQEMVCTLICAYARMRACEARLFFEWILTW